MPRLSSSIEDIGTHYSVVVIGSGYGGAIAASRLSRAGQQVCVLERGLEFQPGEYPNTWPEVLAQTQVDTPDAFLGSRTGLYDMRINDDINVFCGCGLGGTSLVNANVSLPAEPRVFDDLRWPEEFRADVATRLQTGYELARRMLGATPYPDNFPALAKLKALEKSAASLHEKFYRPPINVTFSDGVNSAGVAQHACTLCGDCVTGCNYGAKNTVLMNYLPDARNLGAQIYTQVVVRFLEQNDGLWVIHYQVLDSGREQFDAPTQILTANMVVLAAGVLGSTEILLRSKMNGLGLSDHVGQHFTGNGDVLAFGYDTDDVIDGIGYGSLSPQGREPVGPCITGVIDDRLQPQLDDGMVIEEGSIPGALGPRIPAALAAVAPWAGTSLSPGADAFLQEPKRERELDSLVRGPYHGAVQNTQTYLVMTHDDSEGYMAMEGDRLRLHWPGAGIQPVFTRVNDRLDQAIKPLGGVFVKNPLWSDLTNHTPLTVHPLGGCSMSTDASTGVANHKGQVFCSNSGTAVYDNLYVCDGSVIPRSLGVNPLLTISAVAERCCALIAQDRGWTIDYDLSKAILLRRSPRVTVGLRFTEAMKGFFSTKVTDDFVNGTAQGKQDNSSFVFILTVVADDLNQLLTGPDHSAPMVGVVTAPALSSKPLTVSQGEFHLLMSDPTKADTRLMKYCMNLISEEGKTFVFEGTKIIRSGGILNIWHDTSTLYVTISDLSGVVLGKGILVIEAEDFMRHMTTMEITNAKNDEERLASVIRFGQFFAGALFDIYGSALAPTNEFSTQPVPRKKRPLRMCAPEVHHFLTEDNVELRLTRYKGGAKGPVMLSPGYGTSTVVYTIDTVDTNFPEFLYANGYDVWLFDYRGSPALRSERTQFTLDDVATKDYPAAVAQVRAITGAPDIQIMAHCVGSLTFLMSMLSGKLQGIRSAVCSQVGFYPITSPENKLKAAFDIGSFFKSIGIETLTNNFDPSNWGDLLDDGLLKLSAALGPPCNSAVCRRIWLIYGEVYGHTQLNEATHQAIHEMLGIADVTTFNHLSTIIRAGKVVDKDGNDVYLPNIERLKIPLVFFQAMENHVFLPEGTDRSFQLLCDKNGAEGYLRMTVPNYHHMDCFIGKNAAQDIYPLILGQLDVYNLVRVPPFMDPPDLVNALLRVEEAISLGQLTPENPEVRADLLDRLGKLVADLPQSPQISSLRAARIANLLWYRSHISQLNVDEVFIKTLSDPEPAVRLAAADLLTILSTIPDRWKQPELVAKVSTAIQQQLLVENSPALAVQLSDILKKLRRRTSAKTARSKLRANPYIAGLPIREGKDFYDREAILNRIRDSFEASGRRIIVYGGRRTGKTSLLCKLLDEYLGPSFLPVYLDLQSCSGESIGKFLTVLANAIRTAALRRNIRAVPEVPADEVTCEWLSKFLAFLLGDSVEGGVVLLLDEYEVLTEFFADLVTARQMTALFDNQPRLFAVFAGEKLETVGDSKNLGRLLDTAMRVEITFLEQDDARRLVIEPAAGMLKFEERSVEELYSLCHGHPFYTQLLCQSIFDEMKGSGTVTPAEVQTAADRFVQNATPHLLLSWSNDLNLAQKLVASVLAEHLPGEPGTVKSVLAYLKQDRFPIRLTAEEAYSALTFLQRFDWLKRAPRSLDKSFSETMRVEFTMDLLRKWICEYSPPWNLVEEQREKVISLGASPGARLGAAGIDLLVILLVTIASLFLHGPLWFSLLFCAVYYGATVIFCNATPGMRLATRTQITFASEVGQPLGFARACLLAMQIAIPSALISIGLWLTVSRTKGGWGIALLAGGLALDLLHLLTMRRDHQRRGIFDRWSRAVVIATKHGRNIQ